MNKRLVLVAFLSLSTAVAASAGAADMAAGKKIATGTCAGCHGADGNAVNPAWPKLAGQHAKYLVKQLKDFKAGRRKNNLMSPMAAGLSAADAANVAAYFSAQKQKPGAADPKLAAAGGKIYRGGNRKTGVAACMGCHGPTGMGNPQANFPRLAGQNAAYVAAQLRAFKAGTRTNDMNKMMQNIAARMSDKEIDAVAAYVQGLH